MWPTKWHYGMKCRLSTKCISRGQQKSPCPHWTFGYFYNEDEPTYTKPEVPFVTFDISLATVQGKVRQQLRNCLHKSRNSFVNGTDLWVNTVYPTHIILTENAVPKVIHPFRIPYHLPEEMMLSIQNLF